MRIVPDLLVTRVLIRLLGSEWEREYARKRRVAEERARAMDADEVGRRADERATAREIEER